jgi:hypothetical protein
MKCQNCEAELVWDARYPIRDKLGRCVVQCYHCKHVQVIEEEKCMCEQPELMMDFIRYWEREEHEEDDCLHIDKVCPQCEKRIPYDVIDFKSLKTIMDIPEARAFLASKKAK